MYYVALIHKEPDSDYGIMFPDFPGCISAGSSIDEAVRHGAEALAGHVDLMRGDGDPIPSPRSLEDIRALNEDWIEWDGAVSVAVPLLPATGRTIRLNITLDKRLVAEIDAVATNRSAFLADAARKALNGAIAA